MEQNQYGNEIRERMINVEIRVVCTNCNGYGSICDYGCQSTRTDCQHRLGTSCNCDEGMRDRSIWIPESVIAEWRERQPDCDGNWNVIQDDDRIATRDNIHSLINDVSRDIEVEI